MSQVGGKDAGTVEHFLDAIIGAAVGGHEAAKLLGDQGLWKHRVSRRDGRFRIEKEIGDGRIKVLPWSTGMVDMGTAKAVANSARVTASLSITVNVFLALQVCGSVLFIANGSNVLDYSLGGVHLHVCRTAAATAANRGVLMRGQGRCCGEGQGKAEAQGFKRRRPPCTLQLPCDM